LQEEEREFDHRDSSRNGVELRAEAISVPVHPVHKTQKLVLLGRQGGKQRIACIHAHLRLC
jgi:hypothetical protein